MEINRRDMLKMSASVVGAALLGSKLEASTTKLKEKKILNEVIVGPLKNIAGMRLATCLLAGKSNPKVVIVLENGNIIDIEAAAKKQHLKLKFDPSSMLSLIAAGEMGLSQLKTILEKSSKANLMHINQVEILSPIPNPARNIYCIGWNYLEHFEEGKAARADKAPPKIPDFPVIFTKGTHTMNGPFSPIYFDPNIAATSDWEAELAVIIGKKGKNISAEQAMEYVYGYSIYNDTTVRDIQQKRQSGQWFKGKSIDGYGPMGPFLVTANGLNLDDVRVICRINGVEKQNGSYKDMYFKIPAIIAELSRGLTLEPGDIIATGTPPGVGYSRTPPEFLKPGDVMETEITGIGLMKNTIEKEA